ncbi:hypothetical protein B1C78_12265 [Thioalkalivibrio denitrificans]|uniref:DUF4440 domain-containing protein n=1 Tax=Thioalkalivibrio denitrificans TaxID=108003 RepID=A0A1V3NDM1_9GAMM|nr:hypothetical protein [Thioalkalivibrio denitrificans]OOG23160.1 hypothetical protein B1C78_12265 [Thioalkalivibrio denitrificans]
MYAICRSRITFVGVLLACVIWAAGAGCAPQAVDDHEGTPVEVRPGRVTDMAAFEAFIATRPTAEDFRRVYPDVMLVMRGDITTQEYRTDNSRYFARFDEAERITGGEFR